MSRLVNVLLLHGTVQFKTQMTRTVVIANKSNDKRAYTEPIQILNWAWIDMTVPGGATSNGYCHLHVNDAYHERRDYFSDHPRESWPNEFVVHNQTAANDPPRYYGYAE